MKLIAKLKLISSAFFIAANFAAVSQAQMVVCHTQSHSLHADFTGPTIPTLEWSTQSIPKFNSALGTLIGFRFHVEGGCTTTIYFENWKEQQSQTINPSTSCAGNLSTYTPNQTHIILPQATPVFMGDILLDPYDGITDYGGTSGITTDFDPIGYSKDTYIPANSGTIWQYTQEPSVPVTVRLKSSATVNWGNIPPLSSTQYYAHQSSMDATIEYIYTSANTTVLDCNHNNVSDSCDILTNGTVDSDNDGYPDECSTTDCDLNGIYDVFDLQLGAPDCNANNIPDSCEIATFPSIDSDPDFANDGIPDICQGRVVWDKPINPTTGIQNATIRAYNITGSANAPVFHQLAALAGAATYLSDSTGRFLVPKEYFKTPPSPGEIGRGIKATITYIDDTGIQTTRQITNYPGWDPLKPMRFSGSDRKIVFPPPAVFQAGVYAQVNSGSVDTIRDFFTLDAGSNTADADIKRGKYVSGAAIYSRRPIPAFLFFAMPSAPNLGTSVKSDGISWGYDNNGLLVTEAKVADNANRLEYFMAQKIKPQLDSITSNNDSSLVPLNLLAHSYGGVITRKWMSEHFDYPVLNRYVSFDGAHGGTAFANFVPSFFNEGSINGRSLSPLQLPILKGWNYAHVINNSPDYLLYSEMNEDILSVFPWDTISPFTSAFGIGRTSVLFTPAASGFCKRFIGGWEQETFEETHSIQSHLAVVVSAARFLTDGSAPYLGTAQDPGDSNSVATFSAKASDSRYASAGCFVSNASSTPSGSAYRLLNIPVSGQANFSFPVDQIPGSLHFEAYVSDLNATLDLYVGTTLVTKLNPVTIPFGNNDFIHTFDFNYTGPAAKTLRLTSSTPAFATVNITFSNSRRTSTDTDALTYDQGSTVVVLGKMLGATNNTIIPTSGTVKSTITAPDGTSTLLQLFDDGLHNDGQAQDGTYANTFSATSLPGFYKIFTYTDYNLQGWIAYRTERTSFEVKSTAAALDPTMTQHTVDSNNDGVPDAYAIDFTVNAALAGKYRLLADISNGSETLTSVDSVFSVTPGSSTQTLLIPLKTLYALPSTGTISLTEARLVEPVQGQTMSINPDLVLTIPSMSSFEPLSPPIISNVLPNFGPISGGYNIMLKGENFVSTSSVIVGANSASFTVLGDDTLQIQIPPATFGSVHTTAGTSSGQPSQGGVVRKKSTTVSGEMNEIIMKKEVQIKVLTDGGQIVILNAFTYIY